MARTTTDKLHNSVTI